MEHSESIKHLEHLVKETYTLWEPGWVTFNWRNYTYDHVCRVRGLALTILEGEQDQATPRRPEQEHEQAVVKVASLLHDITKPYDGEYVADESGKRVVDANGFWRNHVRVPSRRNEITEIYDRLGLAGQLHHESGAAVAHGLLQRLGFDGPFGADVAQAIRDHLQARPDAPIAGRCLYDADTIDANIGLPAFVRNIYINLHFYDLRKSPDTPPLEKLLQENPLGYLRPYVLDKLPDWSRGKERDFLPRILTETGRKIARLRLARLQETWTALADELQDFDWQRSHGRLAVLLHFMNHTNDPSIAAETSYLVRHWLTTNGATPEAGALLAHLEREMSGVE